MQQLATAMIAAASPRNANVGNRVFIATAGLTPWAAIIKPKVCTLKKQYPAQRALALTRLRTQ